MFTQPPYPPPSLVLPAPELSESAPSRAPVRHIPTPLFRHTRACRGYLDANSTIAPDHLSRHSRTPPPIIPHPLSVTPAPQIRHARALGSVIPALAAGISTRTAPSPHSTSSRHSRSQPLSYPHLPRSLPLARTGVSRRQRAKRPERPPSVIATPNSVAPNLIWGPYGGCWRHGVPSGPANGVERTTRGFGAAHNVGFGPQIKFGATEFGVEAAGGVRGRFPLGGGNDGEGSGNDGRRWCGAMVLFASRYPRQARV